MSALGPTSRNLVAAARRGLDPSADVAARVRAKVALAVGAGATAATTMPRAASVAPKAAVFGTGKILAITAIVGALVTAAWFVERSPVVASAPAIVVPAETELDSPNDLHVEVSASGDAVTAAPVAPRATRASRGSATIVKPPAPPPAVESTPAITLAREVELVDTAMSSLRANDPANALATLVVYERETAGHGQLAEDAAALEIEARCRSNTPVTNQLRAFDERWPRSVQRERIVTACDNR
ncbi:MAG TPA: hypothetical protein VFQ65_14825 [Kofleriaceae bacterium]|nr:hypothetical protein [Kofleriaceae bacterium]